MNNTLFIGIGNEHRGDDGVGKKLARSVRSRNLPNVHVREEDRDGLALVELWKGYDFVVAVDAVSVNSEGEAGAIHRFEVHKQPIPSKFLSCSTHAFGLAVAVELARVLKELPRNFIVYGIEGKNFSEKVGLSQEVQAALPKVEAAVLRDLDPVNSVNREVQDA